MDGPLDFHDGIGGDWAEENPDAEVNLDALAALLPADYQGHWIAALVRAYGARNGLLDDGQLLDFWQEAVQCACKALCEAREKNGNAQAFVKCAVRSRLSNLSSSQARHDSTFAALDEAPSHEESSPDATAPLGPHHGYRADDVRLALLLVLEPWNGPMRTYWNAFRATNGSARAIGRRLGVSHHTVRTHYERPFLAAARRALGIVRRLRKGTS